MTRFLKRTIKSICFVLMGVISLILGLYVGNISSSYASSNRATGFYRSDFVQGIAVTGPAQFATHQSYLSNTYSNSTSTNWKSVTQNSKVEFIHTHGASGLFTLTSSTNITGNMVQSMSFSDMPKLIYISACQTGNSSTTYGNVGQALVNKGADAVVAFKTNISASTNYNGIHKFNAKVATKLAFNGYTLTYSITTALNEVYAEDGQHWGANSYIIYGDSFISF